MSWSTKKITDTAQSLVDARLKAEARNTFPGDIPPDLNTAYAVQSQAISKWPDQLVGFKVGGIPPHFRDQYPSEWLAGPVFKKNVYQYSSGVTLDFPVFQDGFAAFEPELIFEIDSDIYKSQDHWTPSLAKPTIKHLYLGAEIAASPNINVNALGPGSIISDFGNNGGCILGRKLDASEIDKALNLQVETIIDGQSVGVKSPATPPSGPLGALSFLLNHFIKNANLYEKSETLLVSSGAITGVHESHVGAIASMNYENQQDIVVRLADQKSIKFSIS